MPDRLSADAPVIDRILELAPAQLIDVGGFLHIDKDKSVTLFRPPVLAPVGISTLTGLVALLEAGFEEFVPDQVLVRVVAHDRVDVEAKSSDAYGRRLTYIQTVLMQPEIVFKFNSWYPQEQFNIALLSLFEQDAEMTALLAITGNLAQQNETRQEDDGVTQRVTMKGGIVLKTETNPKPRWSLKPYRTFREIEQPAGEFLFRVRGGEGNSCALFDADGGFWKITAVTRIREWLANQLKGSTVAGLPDIPVIC